MTYKYIYVYIIWRILLTANVNMDKNWNKQRPKLFVSFDKI